MKRILSVILLAAILCSCGNQSEIIEATVPTDKNSLWIVTEKNNDYGMYGLIKKIRREFRKENEGITIKLDVIPTSTTEREAYLEQLRVQIMAGQGPDIYLLPVKSTHSNPLFVDIEQSMHNGLFADISPYYNTDDELEKEKIVSRVMEAGVLGQARYILPLRYNIPVAYVAASQLEEMGVSIENFGNGISGIVDVVQISGRNSLVSELLFMQNYWLNFFPELIDYDTQEVILSADQMADFLEQYRSLMDVMKLEITTEYPSFSSYILEGEFWAKKNRCVCVGSLNYLMRNVGLAKATETDLTVIPLRAADGSLVANISYFGAIDANCSNPKLAYEFLREFLTADAQWENIRPTRKEPVEIGLVADGWPVLADGATEVLYGHLWKQVSGDKYAEQEVYARKNVLRGIKLTDEDLPILDAPINDVRFPLSYASELYEMVDSQLNPTRNTDAMNVDVEKLAKEIIWTLELHLAEG